MANMNKRQRDYFYSIIAKRDGEYCRLCGKTKDEAGMLEIHETNYSKPFDSFHMLFLCHGCNHEPTLTKQQIISQKEHDPSHIKNIECEPFFEDWLYGELALNNWHIPLTDAIDNGAYNVGISQVTARRYIGKLTAKDAPYTTSPSSFGVMHIWLKSKMPVQEPKYV